MKLKLLQDIPNLELHEDDLIHVEKTTENFDAYVHNETGKFIGYTFVVDPELIDIELEVGDKLKFIKNYNPNFNTGDIYDIIKVVDIDKYAITTNSEMIAFINFTNERKGIWELVFPEKIKEEKVNDNQD